MASTRTRTRDVEPSWKRALDENVRFLQENLLLTNSIFGHIIQESILTMEMIEMIKTSSETEHGRTLELVKCLKRRNKDCFEKFLEVLRDSGNTFIAEKLEKSISTTSRQSSRESCNSDEIDQLLQSKDQQIRILVDKLLAKDRRIKELENVADNLKSRVEETLGLLREEMRFSGHLHNSRNVFYDSMQAQKLTEMEQEINEKDEQLREAGERMEELQGRIEELREELACFKENLRTREEDLSIVLENERRLKRNLGLDGEASERELIEHLQQSSQSRSELKRVEEELEKITLAKLTLDDRMTTLAHQNDSLQLELRQKELELERLRRGGLNSAISKRKPNHSAAITRGHTALMERIKIIPRIDLNSALRRHEPVPLLPSLPARPLPFSRVFPPVAQEGYPPKFLRARTIAGIEDKEGKYCVICRRNYYLRNECRIHVGPNTSGRFSCCGANASGKYVGCRTVNHLYIHFTGVGNDFVFYDDTGRSLDFREH